MVVAARSTPDERGYHEDWRIAGAPPERPVDLVHLARQTLGDPDLEREILALFLTQLRTVSDRLAGADSSERLFLVHGLKGTARSVGAFPLAQTASGYEDEPGDAALAAMTACLAQTAAYVERLLG